jgi:hypothetical protein
MEEHKNIINTYYSLYSKRLDNIFKYNLNNSLSIIGKYSDVYNNINQKIVDNQIDSMRIIKGLLTKI